jgi:hypothetical protein
MVDTKKFENSNWEERVKSLKGYWEKDEKKRYYFNVSKNSSVYIDFDFESPLLSKLKIFINNSDSYSSKQALAAEYGRIRGMISEGITNIYEIIFGDDIEFFGTNQTETEFNNEYEKNLNVKSKEYLKTGFDFIKGSLAFVDGGSDISAIGALELKYC